MSNGLDDNGRVGLGDCGRADLGDCGSAGSGRRLEFVVRLVVGIVVQLRTLFDLLSTERHHLEKAVVAALHLLAALVHEIA
jgi:hypothetical protein